MTAAAVHRLLNLVPAPAPCRVCAGNKRVAVGDVAGPCPHCQLGLPIADLPWLAEHPRTETA